MKNCCFSVSFNTLQAFSQQQPDHTTRAVSLGPSVTRGAVCYMNGDIFSDGYKSGIDFEFSNVQLMNKHWNHELMSLIN
jgi:hypothetical protein